MKSLRRILIFVALIVLFIIGLAGIVLQPTLLFAGVSIGLREFLMSTVWYVRLLFCFLLVLVPLTVFLITVKIFTHKQEILIKSEEGTVAIAESAIVKYLKNAIIAIPAVCSVRSQLTDTKKGLCVKTFVQVEVIEKLPAIEKQIREKITESLVTVLGIEHIDEINVVIEDFRLKRKAHEEILATESDEMIAIEGQASEPSAEETFGA